MRSLLLILMLTSSLLVAGQSRAPLPDDIHPVELTAQQRPIPYPFLREHDVIWTTTLWKTIDSRELFNQFFYFPDDEFITFGKKALAYIIWDAVVAGEIPIYEDDNMYIALDNEQFVKRFTKADTILLEIGYDEDDNELYETVIRPRHFEGQEVLEYALREAWYIERRDTKMDSRRLALAPLMERYRELGAGQEAIYLGVLPLFWIPMQHPAVRTLLVRHNAYIDGNMAAVPSWDWVFVNQHYNAYTTRESNVYDRSIKDYLTGLDVIMESEEIESKVFEMGEEMWDY